MCGIEPVWASEIEPFAISVTKSRFPNMKHLGDIKSINGAEIEPVDVIVFGSPCQNLSIAGNRTGLAGTESSLFMEAVRIIKEMREATNGIYPNVAIWENVVGAYSSNGGEDFRTVLQELCGICDPEVYVPRPEKWAWSGEILGNGFSLAWRTLDAQYWGVPQRRRRIFACLHLRGERAGEVLYKREGLSRNFAEMQRERETASETVRRCPEQQHHYYAVESHPQDSRVSLARPDVVQTLPGKMGTGGGNVPLMIVSKKCDLNEVPVLCRATDQVNSEIATDLCPTLNTQHVQPFVTIPYTLLVRCGRPGGGKGALTQKDKSATLSCMNNQSVFVPYTIDKSNDDCVLYLVRKLTPTECAALQGFPSDWCSLVPHADTPEYKLWGNGMALPCILYVMEGVAELESGDASCHS